MACQMERAESAAVIGAQDTTAEGHGHDARHGAQGRPFAGVEPTLRPREDRPGTVGCIAQRAGNGRRFTSLVAKQDAASRRPVREQSFKRLRFADFGEADAARLLRRLDGIGAHPFQIHARDNGAAGEDRLKHAHAQLGRLLSHVIGRPSS